LGKPWYPHAEPASRDGARASDGTAQLAGTPEYMAPEVVFGSAPLDVRAHARREAHRDAPNDRRSRVTEETYRTTGSATFVRFTAFVFCHCITLSFATSSFVSGVALPSGTRSQRVASSKVW
jgi:serine/threonine protein kinase